jgi:hypothetical protein
VEIVVFVRSAVVMHCRTNVHAREQYEWRPSFCELVAFDGPQFCKILGDGNQVLFVGDSTMIQQAVTLMNSITHSGGNCSDNVFFGHNNELFNPHQDATNRVWIDYVEQLPKVKLVVLGMGAWFHAYDDYERAWNVIIQQYRYLENNRAHRKATMPTFVWKTINPAHQNCTSYHEPILSPLSVNTTYDAFGWSRFPEYDSISKEYSYKLHWNVIDMFPLHLRPDAHPPLLPSPTAFRHSFDCLHYCLPGPLNLFNDILLTMMLTNEIVIP